MKHVIQHRLRVVALIVGLTSGILSYAFVTNGAAVWTGPSQEPPLIGSLGSVVDTDDLVNVTLNTTQEVQGQLGISRSGSFPVFLGRNASGVVPTLGVAGFGILDAEANFDPDFSTHDELGPTISETYVGLLGHSTGSAVNYGIYTVTDTGTAVGARASGGAPSYGAWFSGDVSIEQYPSVNADGSFTYPGVVVAQDKVATQISSGASIIGSTAQSEKTGIYATSQTNPSGSGIGAHGQSMSEDGVELTIADEIAGMYALSTDYIGLYGYSTSSTGIFGTALSAGQQAVGVYGYAEDYGLYATSTYQLVGNEYQNGVGSGSSVSEETGVGIFACGTTYAARFEGDLVIKGALKMGIDDVTYVEASESIIGKKVTPSVSLDKATIQSAFTQCVLDGGCSIVIP